MVMVKNFVDDLKKIRQVRSLGKNVKFIGRIVKRLFTRDPHLVLFSTRLAFDEAVTEPPAHAKSHASRPRAESFRRDGLTYHQDVLSIPLTEGKVKDYAGGLIDTKTLLLIDEGLYFNYRKSFSQELPDLNLPELLKAEVLEIKHPVLFGGLLWNNFGHFLLESLSR